MTEAAARERAFQRLQALAKDAAACDTGRLPNQLATFALIVRAEHPVMIEWVRTLLEELRNNNASPEHQRIVREALDAVRELLSPPL